MIAVLIKSSLIIIVLLAFYKILLAKESFFTANRLYLLSCLILAFVLPFVALPKLIDKQGIVTTIMDSSVSKETANSEKPVTNNNMFAGKKDTKSSNSNALVVDQNAKEASKTQSVSESKEPGEQHQTVINEKTISDIIEINQLAERSITYWLVLLYFFGFVVFSLKLLAQITRTFWVAYKSDDKIEYEGGVIVNINSDIEPCSFLKYIFINPSSHNPEVYEQVIAHEKIHVSQWHTIDLLLSELAIVLLWFNPIIWMFRKEVEKNIEYQTDDLMVSGKTETKESYQLNLIKIATYTQPLSITTNYNQSQITQRILKLNSKKSHPNSYWKYTFVAPLIFMLLLILNKPNLVNAQINVTEVNDKGSYIIEAGDELVVTISGSNPLEEKHIVMHNGYIRILDGNQKIGANGSTLDQVKPRMLKAYSDYYNFKPSEFKITLNKRRTKHTKVLEEQKVSEDQSNLDYRNDCKELYDAILNEDFEMIKELLQTFDPNCKGPNVRMGWQPEEYRKVGYTPLSVAAKLGNEEIAQLLIDAGADINVDDVLIKSPLMAAALEGNFDFVKFLVSKGALLNIISNSHGSALHCAARGGHLEIVKYLINKGANVNSYTYMHGTPFFSASKNGHSEIADFLVEQGIDLTPKDTTEVLPLERASAIGNNEIVKLLLSLGADINPQQGIFSPLCSAAWRGRTQTVELLLDKGANIDYQNNGEYGTALNSAARWGHTATVKMLASKGANINLQSGELGTALIAACKNGHTETAAFLISAGASIDLQTNGMHPGFNTEARIGGQISMWERFTDTQSGKNITALIAASRGGHVKTVELLLERGAAFNLQNDEQGNALNAAARNGSYKTVELLLSKGVNINTQNDEQGTALNAAARNGHRRTVELLLAKGADIDLQNDTQGSALNAAARNGHTKIIELLLSSGADINLQNDVQGTALNAAARNGKLETVKLLLAKGADANLSSKGEGKAINAAYRNAHREVAKLLEANTNSR